MPLAFLLSNWRLISFVVVVVGLTMWLGITKIQLANTRAEYATHLLSDSTATAQFNAESALKDSTIAELTNRLDTEHETAIEAIHAVEQDYAHKFAEQLRKSARPACGAPMSVAAPGTNFPPGSSSRSPDRLSSRDREALDAIGRDFARLGAGANKIAATVRDSVPWAKGIGR